MNQGESQGPELRVIGKKSAEQTAAGSLHTQTIWYI